MIVPLEGPALAKAGKLWDDGYRPIGVILQHPKTLQRVTVDEFGRVQWWETGGEGRMSPQPEQK